MDAYIYQGALYCEDCAEAIKIQLGHSGDAIGISFEDSELWPVSVTDGGGEADTPQHCDECHCFLENPLTSDGYTYVVDYIAEFANRGCGDGDLCTEYASFYGVDSARFIARGKEKQADNMGLRIDPRTGRTEAGA